MSIRCGSGFRHDCETDGRRRENLVTLSVPFWEELRNHPIPVDAAVVRALANTRYHRADKGVAYVHAELDKKLAKGRASVGSTNRLKGLVTAEVDAQTAADQTGFDDQDNDGASYSIDTDHRYDR